MNTSGAPDAPDAYGLSAGMPYGLLLRGMGDVEAQHLAEQRVRVLAVLVRVATVAAVTGAEIEIAVATELDHAAVVVPGEVGDRQHDLCRS